MKTDKTDTDNSKLLYPKLTYQLRGLFFSIANSYGLGHKEKLYHQALIDSLSVNKIAYEHEKQIPIYSWKDGRKISTYIPDFIINDKIIIELKSEPFLSKLFLNQIYSYMRVSKFELGLIVNFGEEELHIRRLIFTNDRKPFLKFSSK